MIADRATLALHLQRQYVFIAIFLTLKPNPYILNKERPAAKSFSVH